MIAENLKSVTQRIARCCEKCGRGPDCVKLVCVTKTASVGQIEEALAAGERTLGENRIQDAFAKHAEIGDRADWHLVGHLQTNKVKDAVRIFSLIHSVDSARLAKAIDTAASKLNKKQDILIQVNVSGESTKYGVPPDGLGRLIKEAALYRNINITGLMTIAPESRDPEEARPYFRTLRELRDKIINLTLYPGPLTLLSMGMTNDFEVAIEEGSNMVRIGRGIFGGI